MKKVFLAFLIVAVAAGQGLAADRWWDPTNGAVGGTGSATPAGTWDTASSRWSTDSAGTSVSTTWAAGDKAFFSAGGDAIGSFAVAGSVSPLSDIEIEEGIVEWTGVITMNPAAASNQKIIVDSGATLSTNSSLRIAIAGGAGTTFQLNGGTLRTTNPSAAGSFVDVDSTITLNGGGTIDYQVAGVLNIIQTTVVISGTGPLTKTGVGIIAISSASTYSGATNITNGEIRLRGGAANRLPPGTSLNITGAGILNLNSNLGVGVTAQTVASLTGNGTIGVTDNILVISGATSTTFSGVIKDTANNGAGAAADVGGGITKTGASTLTLTGANTYTGGTIINTAGGGISIGDGSTTGSLLSNVNVNNATAKLTFNRSDALTYSNLVSGTGLVEKLGAGTLTIMGNDWTNTAGVLINGGTIMFGNAAAGFATTAPITINNTATLDMNNINDTFGSLVSTAGQTTGQVLMGTANLTLGQTAATGRSYGGTITGSGTLTKGGGTFTQTLAGNNGSYSGNMLVTLGKLSVAHADALGNTTGNTQVSSGAELLFDGAANSFTIAEPIQIAGIGPDGGAIQVQNSSVTDISGPVTMSADATLSVSGTGTATYSNASAITGTNTNLTLQGGALSSGGGGLISGVINLGTGSLTKLQGGKWVLSGANLYSGGTIVSLGTLLVNNTTGSGTGSGPVSVTGGTLGGTGTVSGPVTVTGGTLAPGASIGTLDIGASVSLTSGTFDWEFSGGPPPGTNAPIGADVLNVNGTLAIASVVSLVGTNFGTTLIGGTKFVAISYATAGAPGTFNLMPDDSIVVVGGKQWLINYDDTTFAAAANVGEALYGNAVTLTAVPELSSFLTVGLGGMFAIGAVLLGKRYGIAFTV